MRLTNQMGSGFAASDADVSTAIDALDPENNSFTVLGIDEDRYIQTAYEGGGLVVEKRDGGADSHLRAQRTGGQPLFSKDEVKRMFLAYYRRSSFDPIVEWRPFDLGAAAGSLVQGISWTKVAMMIGTVAATVAATIVIRNWLN